VMRFGRYEVTREEIVEYARQFDPQPFHLDEEAAKASMFGGLIASGWHTCALLMRLSVDAARRDEAAATGSPGLDSCRWLKPVRPGDVLTGRTEVLETWPSRSKPIGFTRRRNELINQHGEVVVAVVGITMYERRPAGAA
ncbi:MAG TPA: MaoC family dehydratase, partial [Gemmatimonadales bacterium]|nr:MaoC family dehydratase [Gemmatimonadales bacterium]